MGKVSHSSRGIGADPRQSDVLSDVSLGISVCIFTSIITSV